MFLFNFSYGAIFQIEQHKEDVIYDNIPVCFANKSLCMIGQYIVRASGKEELHVQDGLVCDESRKICTNGFCTFPASEVSFFDDEM